MSVGRKIEDEREAVQCLRAAEREGMSAGAWARAHGVDGRSLHAWQMNIARRGTRAPVRQRKTLPKASSTAHVVPITYINRLPHQVAPSRHPGTSPHNGETRV